MKSGESRQFVIADIHGCCRTFRELIFERLKLTKSDALYLLGDYIDRGPDSKGVIETMLELLANGYDLRPLYGNHEDLLMKTLESGDYADHWTWLDNGGTATLKSYGIEHPADIPPEHISFLQGLPLYCFNEGYLFVHAGLDFSLDEPLSLQGREEMLWNRSGEVSSDKIGGRTLVSGHSIMAIEQIRSSITTKHIRLDNGCFMGSQSRGKGCLIALELDTSTLHIQANIE